MCTHTINIKIMPGLLSNGISPRLKKKKNVVKSLLNKN